MTHVDVASEGIWNPFSGGRHRKSNKNYKAKMDNLPPQEEEDVILNEDPKYPRTRDWLYDHIYFSFYDGTRLYTNQEYIGGMVSRKPHHDEFSMLSQVQSRAVKYLKNVAPGIYTKDYCNAIRYRTIPTVGLEADVTCNNTITGDVDRVSLILPFKTPRITYHHSITPAISINIIVPLRGRVETLKLFLRNLEEILQGSQIHAGLTVVYFEDVNSQEVKRLLEESDVKISNLRTQYILLEGERTFSRGLGLQTGVERSILPSDIVFFSDVDVLFTKDFLVRCRANPVQGHQDINAWRVNSTTKNVLRTQVG
ncbi:Chondroitin sulfate N-acetylgalactosaminyltransferase 2 [Halocaridina rubra]|uniref:Hexosyltransferase n=1 Tax=Halocaridina rubra TaxID=373956 RepID=A0AAN8WNB9_HALRR